MGVRARWGIAVASVMVLCGVIAAPAGAKAGDVWVLDDNSTLSGAIWKLSPAGGAPALFASNLSLDDVSAFAFDRDGDLLVTVDEPPSVLELDLPSGARTTYASGPPLDSPERIALGPDGAVYVTDIGATDDLLRIDPKTRAITTVASEPAISAPRGIAITRSGIAYLGTFGIDGIYAVNLATGAVSTAAFSPALITAASEVTLSPDERFLYFSNRQVGNEYLGSVDLNTAAPAKLADVDGPGGIALLRNGSFLVTSTSDELVHRIGPGGVPVETFSPGPGYGFANDVLVEPARCGKRFPTVAGTDAAEVLNGSPFADVIRGEGGKDQINGGGGKDIICGGKGKDLIRGGAGKDTLRGEGARDRLIGGKGKDSCNGGKGGDSRARACEKVAKIP